MVHKWTPPASFKYSDVRGEKRNDQITPLASNCKVKVKGNFDSYLAGRSLPVCEHMCQRWDDVDSEADQQRPHSRVDGPEEGEDNGKEPYRYDYGQPGNCPQTNAFCIVHPYNLLPDEIQWGTCEPESYKLQ